MLPVGVVRDLRLREQVRERACSFLSVQKMVTPMLFFPPRTFRGRFANKGGSVLMQV